MSQTGDLHRRTAAHAGAKAYFGPVTRRDGRPLAPDLFRSAWRPSTLSREA